jgi:predicted nucleotidyltransferase
VASHVDKLIKQGLIHGPPWFPNTTQWEVIMGSVAYNVSNDTSDMDLYGFCIPPKRIVFPHTDGFIYGYNKPKEAFDQYSQHGVVVPDTGQEYDFCIYSIAKYFALCGDNNPNMVDSLFVPQRCVLHSTAVGDMVRENRKLFLSKRAWHKFKGYAYSQLHKIKTKNPKKDSKRQALVEKHGFDVKFGYHLVRLLDEVEQILATGDLVLGRNAEEMKAVRRGEWTVERLENHFDDKMKALEPLYDTSDLRYSPDWDALTELLLNCLEHNFGKLSNAEIVRSDADKQALREIHEITRKALDRL